MQGPGFRCLWGPSCLLVHPSNPEALRDFGFGVYKGFWASTAGRMEIRGNVSIYIYIYTYIYLSRHILYCLTILGRLTSYNRI